VSFFDASLQLQGRPQKPSVRSSDIPAVQVKGWINTWKWWHSIQSSFRLCSWVLSTRYKGNGTVPSAPSWDLPTQISRAVEYPPISIDGVCTREPHDIMKVWTLSSWTLKSGEHVVVSILLYVLLVPVCSDQMFLPGVWERTWGWAPFFPVEAAAAFVRADFVSGPVYSRVLYSSHHRTPVGWWLQLNTTQNELAYNNIIY